MEIILNLKGAMVFCAISLLWWTLTSIIEADVADRQRRRCRRTLPMTITFLLFAASLIWVSIAIIAWGFR